MALSRRKAFASVVAILFLGCVVPVLAQKAKPATEALIWGGVFYSTAETNEAEEIKNLSIVSKGLSEAAFADLGARLGKVFEGQEMRLIGEHTQGLFKQYESWLVPSKEFFLKLDSQGPAEGGGVKLHLQLWQEKDVVMKTDATLRRGSPLLIEGPKWNGGTLVFAILLRD